MSTIQKEAVRQSMFKRWRKERGIKLVASLMPFKEGSRATALFEGETYVALGKDNNEALRNLTAVLIEEANL